MFADAAMPRKTRKGEQASEERKGLIKAAVSAVNTGEAKSMRDAAKKFDLPYSTVRDHCSKLI